MDPDQTAGIPTENANLTKYNKAANSFKQPLNSNFCFLSAKIIVCKIFNSEVSAISQPLQSAQENILKTEAEPDVKSECQRGVVPMLLKQLKHQTFSWRKGITTMAGERFDEICHDGRHIPERN